MGHEVVVGLAEARTGGRGSSRFEAGGHVGAEVLVARVHGDIDEVIDHDLHEEIDPRAVEQAGGVDEDGAIWGSMNLNGVQLPEYKNGGWSIPAEDDQVAVIHTLTIHPDRAGQGLARQMVAFAEDTARSQGKTVMRFDTGVSNAVSNHLYPAIGYRFAGTVDTFFMGYVHCPLNLYEKKL